MNPSSKYWINNFFSDVKNKIEKYKNVSNNDLYQIFAQTGILYGIPVKSITYDKKKYFEWNNIEMLKIIYIETIVLITVNKLKTNDIPAIINNIYNFIKKQKKTTDNNIENKLAVIENYINKLFTQKTIKSKILYHDSYNFIFIDFYLYFKFIDNDFINIDLQKKEIICETLILINNFINIDNKIVDYEKNIYNYYIESAKNYIIDFDINKCNKTTTINYNIYDNIFVKKVIIDIAIIIFLEDNNIDDQEKKELTKLIHNFELNDNYLQQSIIFVENFIVENSGKILFLNKKKLPYITKSLTERILKLIRKNKNMIISEIRESGELLALIRKSLTTELTKDEKQKVNKQIKDIIKSIPALAIFMIPGGSILLPLILKILPDDLVYPSSFKNEKKL